jgi:hypothetical protein
MDQLKIRVAHIANNNHMGMMVIDGMGQNPGARVIAKISGKWVFIPTTMVY